ncbi:NUDIX hydrolase, partial [Mycetocola sp.]|uniref:NUDIX hydrolase n=1 Tax=Mycetocola sp. TaxID=1871042 RepID=UPI003989D22F
MLDKTAGSSLDVLRLRIATRLGARLPSDPGGAGKEDPAARRAAVVVLLFEHRGVPSFLMIKRVARGSNPGQWALPGGMLEPGESPNEAALRELHEETGVDAISDDILGVLDDYRTLRGIVISPVVAAVADPVVLRRNPTEVASIHPIPLSRLSEPGVPRWRLDADGKPLIQMPLRHDMVVHAPTGAILWQFAEAAL